MRSIPFTISITAVLCGFGSTIGGQASQVTRAAQLHPLTPDEIRKIHDHLWSGPPDGITKELARTTGDITFDPYSPGFAPEPGFQSEAERWRSIVCAAPLVASGTVEKLEGHLSADKGTIYSEAQVRIDDVIVDNFQRPVSPGDSVTLVYLGGTIELSGRYVTLARNSRLLKGPSPGRRYLLRFDRFLPDTHAYVSSLTGWDITDLKPAPLWDGALPGPGGDDRTKLMATARKAAALPTSEGGCEK